MSEISDAKKTELAKLLIEDKTSKLEEEEILHLLLQKRLSLDIIHENDKNLSFGDKMADDLARFAGSWTFIIIFIATLILWFLINALWMTKPYDPYPFILLNLILSCIAAIQAPVIMMSQNREEAKDRMRAQNDYKINLKSEIIIEDLHQKIDSLLDSQQLMLQKIENLENGSTNRYNKRPT